MIHEHDIDSESPCLFSGSSSPSEKMNLPVAPKTFAICRITVWHAAVVGRTDAGRHGIHLGINSFLLKVGA